MRISLLGLAILLLASVSVRAELKWAGMRNPCKLSAEDGLNTKQLGKKIGTFIPLASKEEWAVTIKNVSAKFPQARPWATWAVGDLKDAKPLSPETHEEYLSHMDAQGIDIFLELWPSGKDVPAEIYTWLAKFKHHPCVKGLSIDLEYHKPKLDDATAKLWDERLKSHNPSYRLMLKHWEEARMPPTYRGKGDLIFVNTSSEASIDALNDDFAKWADKFAPTAVAFQIGYPADEDGMDGSNQTGWWKLNDPIKDWGNSLLSKIKSPTQEVGILWVCAKSSKTYNAKWDLTKKP